MLYNVSFAQGKSLLLEVSGYDKGEKIKLTTYSNTSVSVSFVWMIS